MARLAIPPLFTRVFKEVGLVEASNIFPLITPVAEESLNSLPNDEEEADAWNEATAHRSFPSDLDREVYETALDHVNRRLLLSSMSNMELDKQRPPARREG